MVRVGTTPRPADRASQSTIEAGRDVLVAMVTTAATALPIGRDLLARHLPEHATLVVVTGDMLLLAAALGVAALSKMSSADLGITRERFSVRLGGGLILGVLLSYPALVRGVSLPHVWIDWAMASGVAIPEEIVCRGVLFALARRAFGDGGAVLLSSTSFAAGHAALYPLPILALGLLVGLLLGCWRSMMDDLLGPIIGHVIVDAVASGIRDAGP